MMKTIFSILITVATLSLSAQQAPKKIKIILLGTFHFNQSLDSASRLHSNIFSDKRQKELNDIVENLTAQKPDKIFLEFTESNQAYYDSLYNQYLAGNEPERERTKANEIFQLGMKTAKKLGHQKIYGMNYQPNEMSDSTFKPRNTVEQAMLELYKALGEYGDTTRTNAAFYDLPFPEKLPKLDSLLQKSTMSEFLLYLNSDKKLMRDEYVNWNYLYSVGTGTDITVTDYVGTFWYGTNLRNFNNVLRNVEYEKDECYLIIYGSSHIPILKYFFSMHPYFEVQDLNNILK